MLAPVGENWWRGDRVGLGVAGGDTVAAMERILVTVGKGRAWVRGVGVPFRSINTLESWLDEFAGLGYPTPTRHESSPRTGRTTPTLA